MKNTVGISRKQLVSEHARQVIWKESLVILVKEGAALEWELRARSWKRGGELEEG